MRDVINRTGSYKILTMNENIIQVGRFNHIEDMNNIRKDQVKMSKITGKYYFIDVQFDEENYK